MSRLLKVVSGVVVWLIVSYIGTAYFPEGLWDFFGIMGFILMILIIYSNWWYPRFRRWRRGY